MNNLSEEAVELYLDELYSSYLAGDNFQLIAAMRFCAGSNREMPRWVVEAFRSATDKWYSMQSGTLDEALGVDWPNDGAALHAARKRRREQITVYNKVTELVGSGRRVDEALLREVGSRFRLSNAEVADYYFSVKRFFEPESVVVAIDELLERLPPRPSRSSKNSTG